MAYRFCTSVFLIFVAAVSLTQAAPPPSRSSAEADLQSALAVLETGDYQAAYRLLRPLAEQGVVEAQFRLGKLCFRTEEWPELKRIACGSRDSVQWLQKAANQNHRGAQTSLGHAYAMGTGVPKNSARAVSWYRKAAEQNDGDGQFYLASAYALGTGVAKDKKKAEEWCNRAALSQLPESSYRQAMELVELEDEAGEVSEGSQIPHSDLLIAAGLMRLSAEMGHPGAQLALGQLYVNGYGVPQDYMLAHVWLNLATSRLPSGKARDDAERSRRALEGDVRGVKIVPRISRDQVSEAQRLAREWRPCVNVPWADL